jgi:nucleotide-binding universal stress UspA family protein
MFQHILLPTDGSELAERAVKKGIEFAKSINARVTGFFAIPEYPRAAYTYWEPPDAVTPERYRLHWTDAAKRILEFVAEAAKRERVLCETTYQSEIEPYEGIIRFAETHGCDLIFMASHGRSGMGALLLGSVTNKVLTHTKIPVLVYR